MRKALVGVVVSGLVLFALVAACRPRPVSSSPDIASSPIPPKKNLPQRSSSQRGRRSRRDGSRS